MKLFALLAVVASLVLVGCQKETGTTETGPSTNVPAATNPPAK